ncbi:uncharacterized protein LOC124817735 isoform X2 [Hydra vulgaris]|uniref:uncharacterized protein LOC124817735 isoform X2 n=1 Tax=Hydra vulgaris TaxID=6087 RepID=UPI001F5EE99A|nr:uncharacterized protein LOC124817735 isoform X2 [Hydra vulgaris]
MVTFNLSKLLADNFPPRHIFTSKNVPECAKFLQSKFLSLYADCTVNFNIFKSLAFNLIKKFNECGKRKKFFLTKYKHFLDQNQQCKYLLLEKDSEKEIRTHEEELLLIRKGENLIKQGNQLIKQGERKIKEGELLLRTHGSNVNSVPCRVPKSSAVNTSCTPKPRKSFIKLTNRMKRKRTDSLREREVEELQHAVKRFKSNSSTDATMKRGVDDRSVYSIVFVLLEIRSGEKIIWKNLIPNSPDATRHLLFCFAKETASFIQEKFEHLKNEIFLLKNIEFKLGESTFVVKSSLSTIYTTMNDGKTLNAVVSNMLKKRISSQSCHVCLANSKEFNLKTIWKKNINLNKHVLKLGICSLHLWMRCMEWIFNTACKLPAVKQGRNIPSQKSKEFIENKKKYQHLFKIKLNIRVSFVRKGCGTTNTGNVARKFFNNPIVTGRILNLDIRMIKLFRDLLIDINRTTSRPDIKVFKQKSEHLFALITNDKFLKTIPMSQSVHRVIVHGTSFIRYFKYPIGSLSESAIEARNKENKTARIGHARLTSFAENTRDTANYLFMTSDMYLFCKKNKMDKKRVKTK